MRPTTPHKPLVLKNKTKTYVLLVLVIGVWGTVAYKIIDALNPSLPDIPVQTMVEVKDYRIKQQLDTFSIKKVYRDPFLGTIYKPKKTKTKPILKPKVNWIPVQYDGMISNGGNNKVFLVRINNQQHLLRTGQSKDSMTVVSGNNTYVKLKYQGAIKSFKKVE
ncbi:MAG: hypothetical protein AAGH46_10270 [Bacteroidota bacterium]